MQQQHRSWGWRVATALGSPLPLRASPGMVLPLFFGISVLVLLLAPAGTAARWAPAAGTLSLAVQLLYLARLVFRIHLALLRMHRAGTANRCTARLRRCLFPAINSLFGMLVFTLMFYPLAQAVIGAHPSSGAARLLWLLTVGGAIVTLAFGQMVSLLLDAVEDAATPAAADDTADDPAKN